MIVISSFNIFHVKFQGARAALELNIFNIIKNLMAPLGPSDMNVSDHVYEVVTRFFFYNMT